jgi:hypothetical protein
MGRVRIPFRPRRRRPRPFFGWLVGEDERGIKRGVLAPTTRFNRPARRGYFPHDSRHFVPGYYRAVPPGQNTLDRRLLTPEFCILNSVFFFPNAGRGSE